MDAASAVKTLQLYVEYAKTPVSSGDFKYAVDQLLDEETTRRTGEALAIAYQIFDTGFEKDGVSRQGHEAVREFLLTEISAIDKTYSYADMDEGDIASSVNDILKDYQQIKESGDTTFIPSGIKYIDDAIGGATKGDLGLIAAYTSHGKSMLSVSWAHQAATQGKNVYYATTETTRAQIMNRLIARHSRLPKFGLADGLDHKKIKMGTLNPEQEKAFYMVLKDFRDNKDYGKIFISQLAGNTTVDSLGIQMMKEQREWNIDLAVVDYLNLLKAPTKRSNAIEEATDILKAAKVLATSFNGEGLPIISPWQINREGYEAAMTSGEYQINHLSNASEAEKSSDFIISIFQDQERKNEVYLKFLKTRDSAFGQKEKITVDYRNAYFTTPPGAGVVNLGFTNSKADSLGISA
jgi:replicative DNA helicase